MEWKVISNDGEVATVQNATLGKDGLLIRQEDFNLCRRQFRETFQVGNFVASFNEEFVKWSRARY